MMHDVERSRWARLALDGLSVGDALGREYALDSDWVERRLRREVPERAWRWTDDTAMACAIVGVLERAHRIDPDELAAELVREFERDPSRGYGAVAYYLLGRLAGGGSWRELSPSLFHGTGSMGNGAAMRVAPIGAYFHDDVERVIHEAETSALPTHAHPEGRAGAVAVAVAAALACRETAADGAAWLREVMDHTPSGAVRDGIGRAIDLLPHADPRDAAGTLGTGLDVCAHDTVPFALFCAARGLGDYASAIWTCLDGITTPDSDRDTLLAIVGGVVACSDPNGIPRSWLRAREALVLP